jgi:uncharacterized repeat protein (TIGR03803 family)
VIPSKVTRVTHESRESDEKENAMGRLSFWKRIGLVLVFCAVAAIGSRAQTFTVLHSFDSLDGASPVAGLVQATNGNLYGTTYGGGTLCNSATCGAVFEITTGGTLTKLHSFHYGTDGAYPGTELIQATDGNFYGTTGGGGANNDGGTIFKITAGGTLTTLYSFCSQTGCTDGNTPSGALVQATDGNFYGTTGGGGANNGGTVFKITQAGTLTTLYSFCAQQICTDGQNPNGLVLAADGNFYGTTLYGGANTTDCGVIGCGTVFKITAGGTLTTLYSFCSQTGCTDGEFPRARRLVQATDGNFYGTTSWGGARGDCSGSGGCGTVFKITTGGTLTTLYSFCSQIGCPDGYLLLGGLVQATDGNFYGTTTDGGASGGFYGGTVFKITQAGTLTTLYSFCSQTDCTDGFSPEAGVMQGTDGNLYGTANRGGQSGANGDGTVFSLSVGLGPFVETNPNSGKVGGKVIILGTNLTGSTSVTFNGTPATFTVAPTGTAIKTSVPSGATTGKVQVVTPSGTLTSNVNFRVRP